MTAVLHLVDRERVPEAPAEKPAPPAPTHVRHVRLTPDGHEVVTARPTRHVVVETAQERDARIAKESKVGRGLLAAHVGETTGPTRWRP